MNFQTGSKRVLGWFSFFFMVVAFAVVAAPVSKVVMVYYTPWFVAKPYSSQWGWHWTMNRFNPDKVNALGEREITSWYYPLIGPYDSSDPAVLEYHVLLMKLAGVDGVIVDWYGSANYLDYESNNRATEKLFEYTKRAGLKFAICYEDQTIQHMIDGKFITADKAVAQAQEEMVYLQTHYFSDPSYLRLKGQPLLLNFGPQFFTASSDWQEIFSVLAETNRPAFFTEDNRLSIGMGAFNWSPMWLSQMPGTGGVLSSAALKSYLDNFDQKASAWPAFISSAFPRFHDIYHQAGGGNSFGYVGDQHGDTFRETLSRAMTNASTVVQIVTWNDFGEGSVVEPTVEFGFRDLGILQDYRRKYLEPNFDRTTNDLRLAPRFYDLRQQSLTNSNLSAGLDQVFTNIIAGQISRADDELRRLEK